MKILKPPTNNIHSTVYTMYCPRCGALLEFDHEDLSASGNGLWATCPCCQNNIDVNNQSQPEEEPEPPHFVWPSSFYHFGESAGAVNIPDKEVQQIIDRIVKRFPELNDGEFTYEGTGDTIVIGLKFNDSNEVIVAKNYWEDEIETEG